MTVAECFDFELMGKLAEAWRGKLTDMEKLAVEFKYIRIGGKGYRPVSICRENPCGSLGETGSKIEDIKVSKKLGVSAALEKAIDIAHGKSTNLTPGNGKPEHTVQAGLIHHALTHGLSLKNRLEGFDDEFDDLLFVSDETRMDASGQVRTDILAVGVKGSVCFPVFIELKAKRTLGKVVDQLANARAKAAESKDSFVKMLSLATGGKSIKFDAYKLLIIWPGSESGKTKDNYASIPADERKNYLIGQFEYYENKQGAERKDALFNATVTLQSPN